MLPDAAPPPTGPDPPAEAGTPPTGRHPAIALPAGYAARHATWDDLHAVAALFASSASGGRPPLRSGDLRVRWLTLDTLDDTIVVEHTAAGPRVLAYADQQPDPAIAGSEPALHTDLRVDPAHTGQGIGGALLDHAIGSAQQLGRQLACDHVLVRTTVRDGDERSRSFLAARGFRPVRHLLGLRLDLHAAPPTPAWPPGVRCRTFEPDRDERAAWQVHQQGFADVATHLPIGLDDWLATRTPARDPSLVLLAEHDGEVVGLAVCHAGADGAPEDGWVRDLAVVPGWRRQGIGMALLRTAFAAFRQRGLTGAALEVDDVTLEGAVRLYRRAGMRITSRTDVYARRIEVGDVL